MNGSCGQGVRKVLYSYPNAFAWLYFLDVYRAFWVSEGSVF